MCFSQIEYITGDLLSCTTGAIIHGCNAQGAYNYGVAKSIRACYPQVYHGYLQYLSNFPHSERALGTNHFVKISDHLLIINAITQVYYGHQGSPRARTQSHSAWSVSYTHLTLPTKRIV